MQIKSETVGLTVSESFNNLSVSQCIQNSQHFDPNCLGMAGVASISNAKAEPYLTNTDKSSSTPVENELYFYLQSLDLFDNTKKLFKENKKLLHDLHVKGIQKIKVINDEHIVLYSVMNMSGNSRAGWKLASEMSDTEKARLSSKQRVYEKALANIDVWKYYVTLTLDKNKQDRYDFKTVQPRISHFLTRRDIKYLLVPEHHKDGAIHFHGLMSAELEPFLVEFNDKAKQNHQIKKRLSEGIGVKNFAPYAQTFGHNLIEPIQNPEACVNYITKYVTKSFDDEEQFERFSRRRFFCSTGLKSPQIVFPESVDLESFWPENYSTHTPKVYLRRVSWPVPAPLINHEQPPSF